MDRPCSGSEQAFVADLFACVDVETASEGSARGPQGGDSVRVTPVNVLDVFGDDVPADDKE